MPIRFMLLPARKRDDETLADQQFVTRFICLTAFLFLLLLLIEMARA